MKKFITLVLVLVLALGLTVPAMAFTSDSEADSEDVPYSLKVYLVEYDDNDLFGFATLPESDRGYAKNEIVAAIIELNVPEDEDPIADGYTSLEVSGDNVSFDVTDKPVYSKDAAKLGTLISDGEDGWYLDFSDKDGDKNATEPNDDVVFADDTTYSWLVFAKVTDDEASITAKLIDGLGSNDFDGLSPSTLAFTLEGVRYDIVHSGNVYTITVGTADDDYKGDKIIIDVDDDDVSEGMTLVIAAGHDHAGSYPLGVNTKNELGIVKNAVVDTDGDDFDDVMDFYNDVVVDVFGMDYFKIGNYVRESYFEGLTSSDTVVATVDIEPWTAYVTVPDNIVVDPPKTGDAASIMGFVMVALSGAGVVALRKRG